MLRGTWDLPRPGLEPVSPALAGGFPTTAPPGKPRNALFTARFIVDLTGTVVKCHKCVAGICWSGLFSTLSPGFPREESRCRVAAGRGAHSVRQRGILCSQHGSRWSPPTCRQAHQARPAACHSRPRLHLRSGILTTSGFFSSLFHLHVLESPKAQPTPNSISCPLGLNVCANEL